MAKHPTTRSIDLTGQAVEEKEARKELRRCQLELLQLQTDLRDKQNMAVVVVFEGMDAAGKGGAIRRLTGKLDPRGFVVHPIGAPDVVEKAHHYLWRFQMRMPRRGQIAIFDRSWYGRVLVERIEGFCTEREWKRAYREICDFERTLVDNGQVLIKFWLHVSKQEQLRRFRAREGDPFKNTRSPMRTGEIAGSGVPTSPPPTRCSARRTPPGPPGTRSPARTSGTRGWRWYAP